MGIWSAIKHAINSTLGTSEFEPLDKIIKSQRQFVASEELFCIVASTTEGFVIPAPNSGSTLDLFISRWHGTMCLFVGAEYASNLYINDSLVVTGNYWGSARASDGTPGWRSPVFSVSPGDKISINSYSTSFNRGGRVEIWATMQDLSAIDIILEA